jgi:cysteine desulfuration protein SufE
VTQDTKETLDDLIENFALFDDWEERYRYLIDLGRTLPAMEEGLKTDETLVRGCTSRVWISETIENETLHFIADSDAHIVRAYQGAALKDIHSIDINAALQKIGLDQNLSPNRRNGFAAMVERIRALS